MYVCIVLFGDWTEADVCEQRAQTCYMKVKWARVKPATCLSQVRPPVHTERVDARQCDVATQHVRCERELYSTTPTVRPVNIYYNFSTAVIHWNNGNINVFYYKLEVLTKPNVIAIMLMRLEYEYNEVSDIAVYCTFYCVTTRFYSFVYY